MAKTDTGSQLSQLLSISLQFPALIETNAIIPYNQEKEADASQNHHIEDGMIIPTSNILDEFKKKCRSEKTTACVSLFLRFLIEYFNPELWLNNILNFSKKKISESSDIILHYGDGFKSKFHFTPQSQTNPTEQTHLDLKLYLCSAFPDRFMCPSTDFISLLTLINQENTNVMNLRIKIMIKHQIWEMSKSQVEEKFRDKQISYAMSYGGMLNQATEPRTESKRKLSDIHDEIEIRQAKKTKIEKPKQSPTKKTKAPKSTNTSGDDTQKNRVKNSSNESEIKPNITTVTKHNESQMNIIEKQKESLPSLQTMDDNKKKSDRK